MSCLVGDRVRVTGEIRYLKVRLCNWWSNMKCEEYKGGTSCNITLSLTTTEAALVTQR